MLDIAMSLIDCRNHAGIFSDGPCQGEKNNTSPSLILNTQFSFELAFPLLS
jgi:hypothetical protein